MENSVLLLKNQTTNKFGTGFVIANNNEGSYILTCAHVVDDMGKNLLINSKPAIIISIGAKDKLDLALLFVKGLSLKPLLLESNSNTKEYMIYGNEYQSGFHLKRPLNATYSNPMYIENYHFMQLKIEGENKIKSGFSGSPLICQKSGRVVGVINSKEGNEKAFAIEIKELKSIWKDIPDNLIMDNSYDLFISYRTIYSEWVETLATNLKNQGYKVFLDNWEIIAGDDYPLKINEALENSKNALLVATPDATESGWVQKEYELMQKKAIFDSDFKFIPIVFGEFPDLPFLDTTQAIDFNKEEYKKAYYRLICAIDKTPPNDFENFKAELIRPKEINLKPQTYRDKNFLDELFLKLNSNLPIMIFAKEQINTALYINAIKSESKERFKEDNILHIFPPSSLKIDSSGYFQRVSKQSSFEDLVDTSYEWSDEMRIKLDENEEILLLITGFENGDDELRREFASEIRQLQEAFPFNFFVILIGGQRLAALKYENGDMSLLNISEELIIPKPTIEDYKNIFHKDISAKKLKEIQSTTGGHPRLTEFCLRSVGIPAHNLLKTAPLLNQILLKFKNEKPKLCKIVEKDSLGVFHIWSDDKLLHKLYWNGLLRELNGDFIWSSEFLRDSLRDRICK